jgi:hypothetical protein
VRQRAPESPLPLSVIESKERALAVGDVRVSVVDKMVSVAEKTVRCVDGTENRRAQR